MTEPSPPVVAGCDVTTRPPGVAAKARCTALALAVSLAGCSALPLDGPMPSTIKTEVKQSKTARGELQPDAPLLVPGTAAVTTLAEGQAYPISQRMPGAFLRADRLGPGDTLGVAVIENGPGGLFSTPSASDTSSAAAQAPAGARMVNLPDIAVDQNGTIAFPYLGRIHAAGLTIGDLSRVLEKQLASQTIAPQVLVSLRQTASHIVTVGGAVGHPDAYPIPPQGEHVLEAIARAGGTSIDPADVRIRLVRGGAIYTQTFQEMLDDPTRNVGVRNGDYIDVFKHPRVVLILGAVGSVQAMPMPLARLSLTDAVASSAGLADSRADPRAVYVMRRLPAGLARQMSQTGAQALQGVPDAELPAIVPAGLPDSALVNVVVQYDFNSLAGIISGKKLTLRDGDIVYAGNARATQWQKFMNLISGTLSPASTTARQVSN